MGEGGDRKEPKKNKKKKAPLDWVCTRLINVYSWTLEAYLLGEQARLPAQRHGALSSLARPNTTYEIVATELDLRGASNGVRKIPRPPPPPPQRAGAMRPSSGLVPSCRYRQLPGLGVRLGDIRQPPVTPLAPLVPIRLVLFVFYVFKLH